MIAFMRPERISSVSVEDVRLLVAQAMDERHLSLVEADFVEMEQIIDHLVRTLRANNVYVDLFTVAQAILEL
jgi:hypothetical protein